MPAYVEAELGSARPTGTARSRVEMITPFGWITGNAIDDAGRHALSLFPLLSAWDQGAHRTCAPTELTALPYDTAYCFGEFTALHAVQDDMSDRNLASFGFTPTLMQYGKS